MCGITALSRAPQSSIPDAHRFIIAALIAIESRGYDSTGVAWTRGKQTQVWYHKLVGPASKVAGQLDLAGRAPIRQAIGHTRWSSKGAHTYDNAHPVVADNVVLVHNGVIDNDDELVRLAAVERVGEVDSWAIAGIVQNWEAIGANHPCDVLDLLDGDAAVAWFDNEDPTEMHLARLIGRPMTIGWTKRGDLVMSSTRQTLQHTARLTGVAIGEMIDIPRYTYLKVRGGKIIEWRTIGEDEPRTTKPERRPRPLWTQTKGSPYSGITDRVENRPDDWWDEAERLLGDAAGERPAYETEWPTGIDLIRRRPVNEFDW